MNKFFFTKKFLKSTKFKKYSEYRPLRLEPNKKDIMRTYMFEWNRYRVKKKKIKLSLSMFTAKWSLYGKKQKIKIPIKIFKSWFLLFFIKKFKTNKLVKQ